MSRDAYAPLLERALRRVRQAKAEVAESRRPPSARCPIALVGMACRLPGAADPEAFWALLRDGVDAVGPAPAHRWPGRDWFDPTGSDPTKAYVDSAGYVRDLEDFDPEFFGISPREAQTMDPQQRMMLEVSWQALERAGLPPGALRGSRTGVWVGASNHEYGRTFTDATGRLHPFVGTNSSLSVIAGRVAYALGLEGPAMTLDTACSSALVAVALGVRALQAGDCDRAICGGTNAIVDPETLTAMCFVGMLSRGGHCRTFDAGADGFARGEGCGVVVLERLDDAVRAGRRILGVIRGVAVNQDGRSAGLTAPNKHAQVAVIRAALADGALEPRAVTCVETHGTGTSLGDPIEMSALREALCEGRPADEPLALGAAKASIGHLEPAAGVAGLIKAALMLEHGVVPPNLHFETPNPHIDWDGLPVLLPTEVTPLRPGLIGISAFGLSGTNAHVIIGPPPAAPEPAPLRDRAAWIVPLAARTPEALSAVAAGYADRLEADPDAWPHIATAALTREPFEERATVVAADAASAVERLRALADGRPAPGTGRDRAPVSRAPRLGFVFTGQGAQYAGMGRRLYAEEPVFAAAIDRCAALLADLRPEPLTDVLFGESALIDDTSWTQPALFALQFALAELWASLGVRPHAVVGHSVGAYAAAVVAGAMTLEDGLRLVAERGRLMGGLPAGGAMATVSADERRVLAAARGARWVVAAVNAPDETVISGDVDAVEAAIAAFEAEGVKARRLIVSHAFHSPQMDPIVSGFRARAAACAMARPTVRFIDDRSGVIRSRAPTADDWARHLREPVRFADALRALAGEGCDALIEIGPRPALLAFARRTLGADCPPTLPSLRPGRDAFTDSLAALWRLGAPIDWSAHLGDRGLRRVALPTYPFQRRRLWFEGAGAAPAADSERFAVSWRPRAIVNPRPLTGRWLVIGRALGPAVVDALRAAGLDAEEAPDTAAALARIESEVWAGIIDLAALDGPAFDPAAAPAEAVSRAREIGCDGVLALVDTLGRRRSEARLVLVTRRAVALGAEPADPLQALRTGLGRVVIQERAGSRLVDVDAGPPAEVAAALIAALADDAPELALRGGARYAPRLTPLRPEPTDPPALDGPGTTLITGGLGALGLAIAGRLVERGAIDLALMSRRPPDEDAAARIATWTAAGATVRVVAGDVTRGEDVARIVAGLAAVDAPVTAVIHAAGVLDDGVLLDQTPARLDRVIAPKLLGAWHLDRATAGADLRFFVTFSSVVGLMGNAGQANYAAANAALDAFAGRRAALGRPTLTLRWGPWLDRGMTAGLDARRAKRSGMELLPEGRALAAFERALADRAPAPVILALGDPPPPLPLFDELGRSTPAAAPTRGTSRGHVRAALADASPEARAARVLAALVGHIAAALELDPERVDTDRAAVDLGLDSLLVMEVLDGLEHDLDVHVYPREFYGQPSLRAMADYLLAELAETAAPVAAAEDRGPWHIEEGPLAAFEAEAADGRAPETPVDGVGFVLSPPRSGSTLLRTMLEGHPSVFAPPELWLLLATDMARRAEHLRPFGLDEGYTLAVREALGCTTEEAEARVAEMVAEKTPTAEAYRRLRGWIGDRLLIDKTPLYSQFDFSMQRLVDWFAPGPLIHLTRHPLAVIDSIVRTRVVRVVHGSLGDPWFVAEGIWTLSAERVAAFEAAHPERALTRVRFESLVTRPRETLEGLCDAMGLPFDPAMLDPYGGDRMTGGLHARSAPMGDLGFAARGRIDPALADVWRRVEPPNPLHPRTLAAADALGYDLPARRDRIAVPSGAPAPATEAPTAEAPAAETPTPRTPAAPAAAGPRPLRIPVGRLRLSALAWGPDDGPLVLAVHGLLDHAGVWAPVAERLAARGLRVIAPDLRGHGASDHVGRESGYSLLDHVHDLDAWRAALARAMPSEASHHDSGVTSGAAAPLSRNMASDVTAGMTSAMASDLGPDVSSEPSAMPSPAGVRRARPVAVIGHSMGAAIAAVHAAAAGGDWPLVLIEPPMPTPAAEGAAALGRWLEARAAAPMHPALADLDAAVDRLSRTMLGVPPARLRAFAARAVEHAADGLRWRWDPRLQMRADLAAGGLGPEGWLALLGGLAPAPLLLFGADSRFVRPADRSRQSDAVGGARSRVIAGAHHLPLTAPDVVAAALADALGEGTAAGA